MKLSKVFSIVIFAISLVLFIYSMAVKNRSFDPNGPEITMSTDRVEISIDDDKEKVLEGVTAMDSTDGDVTSSLVVESMSNFIEPGVRQANIVAFDKDNHITRVVREVAYTDYVPTEFDMEAPLVFSPDDFEYLAHVNAMDCMDGDLSQRIYMDYMEEFDGYSPGDYKVKLSVTNSVGDVAELPVTMTILDPGEEYANATIQLNDYVVYAVSGTKFNAKDYLEKVTLDGRTYKNDGSGRMIQDTGNSGLSDEVEEIVLEGLTIDDPVKKTPGVYEVTYTVKDSEDREASVRLVVVVTEK